MTIATMRLIDRYAGVPLCLLAGLFRRFPQRLDRAPKSVLIIKFFGLGSVLLTAPALDALKKKFPSARIVYMSFSRNAQLLAELSAIDERWIIETRSIFTFLQSFAAIVWRLVRTRIDVVIDFEFFSKFSTLVGAFARPQMQIGFSLPTRWRRWNLSHPVILQNNLHVTKSMFTMLAHLGIGDLPFPSPRFRLRPSPNVISLPPQVRASNSDIICVNPNAGETSLERRWDRHRFVEMLRLLISEYPETQFCLIGSRSERSYVQFIVDKIKSGNQLVVNLAGRTSVRSLIELFLRSRILITNDSGPMHLAAAVGLPTIALFGPESPDFYGPLGNHSVNLYARTECSPCLNIYDAKVFRCPFDAKCMKEITVQRVVREVRGLLQPARTLGIVEGVHL